MHKRIQHENILVSFSLKHLCSLCCPALILPNSSLITLSVTHIKYYLTSSTEENAFITYWGFPFNLSLSSLTASPLFLVALSKNGANSPHKDLFRSRQKPTLHSCQDRRLKKQHTRPLLSTQVTEHTQTHHKSSVASPAKMPVRITEPI